MLRSTIEFTNLSRYSPNLVSNMSSKIRKFASGHSSNLVLKCKGAILNNYMDISRLAIYIQVKDEKKAGKGRVQRLNIQIRI